MILFFDEDIFFGLQIKIVWALRIIEVFVKV
jgi:hypothetical protein